MKLLVCVALAIFFSSTKAGGLYSRTDCKDDLMKTIPHVYLSGSWIIGISEHSALMILNSNDTIVSLSEPSLKVDAKAIAVYWRTIPTSNDVWVMDQLFALSEGKFLEEPQISKEGSTLIVKYQAEDAYDFALGGGCYHKGINGTGILVLSNPDVYSFTDKVDTFTPKMSKQEKSFCEDGKTIYSLNDIYIECRSEKLVHKLNGSSIPQNAMLEGIELDQIIAIGFVESKALIVKRMDGKFVFSSSQLDFQPTRTDPSSSPSPEVTTCPSTPSPVLSIFSSTAVSVSPPVPVAPSPTFTISFSNIVSASPSASIMASPSAITASPSASITNPSTASSTNLLVSPSAPSANPSATFNTSATPNPVATPSSSLPATHSPVPPPSATGEDFKETGSESQTSTIIALIIVIGIVLGLMVGIVAMRNNRRMSQYSNLP
mmetsp:Transcript_45276/g.113980  ORF Transcript_45276/g.113980 Transcript_45276/m.113980 type:complete len:433 (-) Transcript_45276:300-1598(-)